MKREIAKYVSECDIRQRLKPVISKLLVFFNLYPFLLGSGRISAWILSLAYPTPL
jgi:hypothetical protein